MKGDFTRRTFRPEHHYRGVLMQQGRVALDADWNEQLDIGDHLDRTTTRDTIGGHGGPAAGAGFEIVGRTWNIARSGCPADRLLITAGRYYVDGILCENECDVELIDQPDLPGCALPATPGCYVAYLDVWFEHLSVAERPELREVALGGPDTATRARTVWQVRLAPAAGATGCADLAPTWIPATSTRRLRARAIAPDDDPGPCVVPTTAGYRRLENQLYRVEIHDGSDRAGGPTFVWSRENGSVAASLVGVDGDVLTIAAPGRDERLGFAKNDWVEVLDLRRSRRGDPGFLGRLDDADGTRLVVAEWKDGAKPAASSDVAGTVVRRWESEGAPPATPGEWTDLEDGVQIQFGDGPVRTGDHWLIPARSATLTGEDVDPDLAGDVDWPRADGEALWRRPEGVAHHYAPVALLELDAAGRWWRLGDCRRIVPALGDLIDLEYAGG